jgi:ABC-type multidrug transport system fused ATPase/permease subunit
MGFILDGLETESYDRTYSDKALTARIIEYFRPHLGKILIVAFTLFLNSLAAAASPVLIARIIDMVSANSALGIIAAAAVGVAVLGSFGWLFNYIHERRITEVVGDVVYGVRSDVFEHTLSHDLSFFDDHSSGRIVSRIGSDTQDFSNVVTLVADFSSQILMILLLTFWLFFINLKLTLLLIVMAPAAGAVAWGFRRIARRVTQDAKRANAEINAQIQESVSGIMIAKSFRKERALFDSFKTNNSRSYRVGVRRGIVLNTIFPVIGFAAGAANAVLAYSGGVSVFGGEMSLGDWYLFMQAVGFYWWPLLNIASFWSQFQDGLSAAERVFALMDREPKVRQAGNEKPLKFEGRIEFRDLTFSYNDKEKVLDRFNLTIEPGETLAVVGHTGAGKSSLARLIARFYEFQEGFLAVDGYDIRTLDLARYRRHIGYVPQEPFLFSGTVRDNIRYGLPEAADEAVFSAAVRLAGGDWLEDLAEGLDTGVGERGANISFGQRQLIALARILLKDPRFFILDEATASVDPFTETQIQDGLAAVMRGRTAVVIAHRLSTVVNADRIIVLHKGSIIEEGTHEGLLRKDGGYAELFNTYFRHQSLDYIEAAGKA